MKTSPLVQGVAVTAPLVGRAAEIVSPAALEFLADLHRRFNPTRLKLLKRREERYEALVRGAVPDFLAETKPVRDGAWRVANPPPDLQDRRVEITGPTDKKMVINALNSGAKVFMADFEDANTPTWTNLVEGQANLIDALERTLEFVSPEGKEYRLGPKLATLMVRPRGWHLVEKHVLVDGEPMSGSLFDFGLYIFHNAKRFARRATGPYFYLPKLEGHLEARLWNEVFTFAEQRLGLVKASIRATVLVETILAAFEMEEILYELRERSGGLNAGRWDYLFSIIKKFRHRTDLLLPDRSQVTMTVPFMRAYTELLVATCHRRGAHAMGGMAAFVPSRKDPAVNEAALSKVREDKLREAGDGFDGTWVAHPDLVSAATKVFDGVLGAKPNQVERQRPEVHVTAAQLLDFRVAGGTVTEAGLRGNLHVCVLYLEAWLRGVGASAINFLMEDAATAEIARSQVWLWIHRRATLDSGGVVTLDFVKRCLAEEYERIRGEVGAEAFQAGRFAEARRLVEHVALSREYPDFLTLPAYALID